MEQGIQSLHPTEDQQAMQNTLNAVVYLEKHICVGIQGNIMWFWKDLYLLSS